MQKPAMHARASLCVPSDADCGPIAQLLPTRLTNLGMLVEPGSATHCPFN
jgi:hypothetical protein